jgi:type IV pilus assembly protein PilF
MVFKALTPAMQEWNAKLPKELSGALRGDVLYRLGDLERARFYIGRLNSSAELSSAQTLWLAARIEQRAGNTSGAMIYGRQLRDRFPQSPEALQFERGRFDD